MKNFIIASAVLAAGLLGLSGCNNRTDSVTVAPAEYTPMQQSFRGILPCVDCGGIDTSLFLEKDGTWVMQQHYQDAKAPSVFSSWGTWARTANKLVLTDSDGEKWYFHPAGESLEMLDREGNTIQSSLNYTLKAVKQSLPAAPMPMKGMYKYMADTAMFTDCATGKMFIMASNAALERGYAAARNNEMKPVLLVVSAHFALAPNPDTGALRKVLVADSKGEFTSDKSCNDR